MSEGIPLKRDAFYRKGRRYGLTRIGVSASTPRPCAFCSRIRVTGVAACCRDEPCREWHMEWLNPNTTPERKARLSKVAQGLRAVPDGDRREAALRVCDEVYANLRGESPEAILARLAERMNCEPRQVADRVIRMLEERRP